MKKNMLFIFKENRDSEVKKLRLAGYKVEKYFKLVRSEATYEFEDLGKVTYHDVIFYGLRVKGKKR